MKLIILSGRSGSGKSTALQALEDLGYYCVDNMPLGLLPTLAAQLQEEQHHIDRIAVGIDARNLPSQLQRFPDLLKRVRDLEVPCEIIFLDADDATLLKRFSATRRKHPLSNDDLSLTEAISREGELLANIRANAHLVIDTSSLDVHTLRDLISERVAGRRDRLSLMVQSFGYKRGVPNDADLVFDVRVLPNPYWDETLRPFSGRDGEAIQFLEGQPESRAMFDDISRFLEDWLPYYETNDRTYMTVAIGCTGGRHRSVFMSEKLAQHLRDAGMDVQIRHRDLVLPAEKTH
ncbi:MAG: RNase adapter RapZ [Alcanivoracaceae bacterium]